MEAPTTPARRDRSTWVWVVMTAAFGLYLWVSLVVYRTYRYGFDLAIFDQVVRHYAHWHAPIADAIAPGMNTQGDHFSPILALLAPLYWLWPDPRMLLVVQAALVALSIWPVWAFSTRRIGARPALVVSVVYALCWEIQALVAFDFHEVAFAVPLIAIAVNAFDQRQDRLLLAACVGLLLVREDMGLFLVGVAIVLAVRRRFTFAAGLALLGLSAFCLITLVVVPSLAPNGAFRYWTFSELGPNPRSALVALVQRPWFALQTLVTPRVKAQTLAWLFAPTLFLSVASVYVLLALPFIGINMLNSRPLLWEPRLHYWAPLAPIVMMAAVDTVGRWSPRLRWPDGFRRLWLAWISLVVVGGTLLAPATYGFVYLLLPIGEVQRSAVAALDQAIATVPAGVCVEADNHTLPHLSPRDRAFVLGGSAGRASWVLIDRSRVGDSMLVDPQQYGSILISEGWRVERQDGSLTVLHRSTVQSSDCTND